MKCGRSYNRGATSGGYGWPNAEEHAKLWPTALADLEGAIGDRSETTCRLLWERIPKRYKRCVLFTDFWKAYTDVLPVKQHRATGKGDGETCHPNKASH